MRYRSVLVLIGVCIATAAVLFLTISVIAQYMAPNTSPPLGPINKASLPQPKTLADKMCCIGDGVHYCAIADHGAVNGVHYYAAATQKGNYPANVATDQTLITHPFQPDADFCQCKDSVFVPLEQLQKAGVNKDEMLIGRKLQERGLQERGLQRFITATEPLQRGDGTRLLKELIVQTDNNRWFRLFRVESWTEVEDGTKSGTQMLARFGQELDPSTHPNSAKKAKLVDTLGCFLKIEAEGDIFFVLTRGPDSNGKRDEARGD